MLLVNQRPIDEIAMRDEAHPMHPFAKEYQKGIEKLRKEYGSLIKFKRPKFPKRTKGLDSRNREVPNLALPVQPLIMPLKAQVQGRSGLEIWEYIKGSPKLEPNGLWSATGKRSEFIYESLVISLDKDPELAFFVYYKSPLFSRENKHGKVVIKQLIIDDPLSDAKRNEEKERADLELNFAIYNTLSDDEQLRVMAQGYGVANADTKDPVMVRKELKAAVLEGEKKSRRDPMAKGIKEFLGELKVTDSIRLRSLVQLAMDKEIIKWFPDGKYKVGERELCKVPQQEISHRQEYLCNHLGNSANRPKLQELLKDFVNKEFLDKVNDDKMFFWLARMMNIPTDFKTKEKTRELIYECFIQE